jgi:hypothetical protein
MYIHIKKELLRKNKMNENLTKARFGLLLGLGVGIAIGTATDNIGVGVGVGVALAVALAQNKQPVGSKKDEYQGQDD